MEEKDENKLIFGVKKIIWLSVEEKPVFKVIGWTTKKPKHDIGFIDKGTLLIFDYIYKTPDIPEGQEGLNFIAIKPESLYEIKPEFHQTDLESLVKEGALEPYLVWTDIDEISITKGNVFIKYPGKPSYHDAFFVPKDIYIVMGLEENNKSMGEFKIGEKISLKSIIDSYTTALGAGHRFPNK